MEKFFVLDGFETLYPVYAESKEDFWNKLVIAISKTASKLKVVASNFKNLTGEEIDSFVIPTSEFYQDEKNIDYLKKMDELLTQNMNLKNMKVCNNRFDYSCFRFAIENKQFDKEKNILTVDEYFEIKTEK